MTDSDLSYSEEVGVGYMLATGKVFAPLPRFHNFAERLAGRAIFTHEFAREELWTELRERFEALAVEAL